MAVRAWPIIVAVIVVLSGAAPSHGQFDGERYSIMKPEPGTTGRTSKSKQDEKPEPWLAPKYLSPRGTREHVRVPRPQPAPQLQGRKVPPDLYVPETGRTLQNLPSVTGRGGRETSQDRAVRCAHQAGVYGPATGDRTRYINSCINQ
jgi:hypothetical protein